MRLLKNLYHFFKLGFQSFEVSSAPGHDIKNLLHKNFATEKHFLIIRKSFIYWDQIGQHFDLRGSFDGCEHSAIYHHAFAIHASLPTDVSEQFLVYRIIFKRE